MKIIISDKFGTGKSIVAQIIYDALQEHGLTPTYEDKDYEYFLRGKRKMREETIKGRTIHIKINQEARL